MKAPNANRSSRLFDSFETPAERLTVLIDDVSLAVRGSAGALKIVADVFRTHATRVAPPAGAVSVDLGAVDNVASSTFREHDVASVCDQVMRAFCDASPLLVLDGAVIVRGEEAVCLVGERPDVAVALAGALMLRGWRLLSAQQVLIDIESSTVRRFHRAMRISSKRLNGLPPELRAACERSPWYVAPDDEIVFYAVDPATQFGASAWSNGGRLTRVLCVEDTRAIVPLIHEEDGWQVVASVAPPSLPLRQSFKATASLRTTLRHVRGGRLRVGHLQDAAEAIDAWCDT